MSYDQKTTTYCYFFRFLFFFVFVFARLFFARRRLHVTNGIFIYLFNFIPYFTHLTRSQAVAENKPIVRLVWNSSTTCWRWLLQTWNCRRFACSQYGFNLFAR